MRARRRAAVAGRGRSWRDVRAAEASRNRAGATGRQAEARRKSPDAPRAAGSRLDADRHGARHERLARIEPEAALAAVDQALAAIGGKLRRDLGTSRRDALVLRVVG